MNTMTAERPPAKAPRMRYPEQALAELKSEDPNTPVTVYMIRRLVAAGTIPSIRMGRRRLLNYDSLGILPGIGQNAATMITYNQSKSVSKHPERFGHGSPEGICASETSNNAVNGGALIPLVTMGIPGDLTTSALLGGLTIHGLQAGPLLFTQNPDIIGTIMVAYALANFVMYIMELGLLKLFIRAIDVKFSFLFPAILMFCVMGVLALNNRMFDVWMMMLFGVVAYVLEQLGVDMTPIILGFILGPMIEKYFRSAMIASSGMFLDVFTRPISCVFMIVAVTFLLLPLFKMLRCRQKARKG